MIGRGTKKVENHWFKSKHVWRVDTSKQFHATSPTMNIMSNNTIATFFHEHLQSQHKTDPLPLTPRSTDKEIASRMQRGERRALIPTCAVSFSISVSFARTSLRWRAGDDSSERSLRCFVPWRNAKNVTSYVTNFSSSRIAAWRRGSDASPTQEIK